MPFTTKLRYFVYVRFFVKKICIFGLLFLTKKVIFGYKCSNINKIRNFAS